VSVSSAAFDKEQRAAARAARGAVKPRLTPGDHGLYEEVLDHGTEHLRGQLSDGVVFVTGAGGGIGSALSKAAAAIGGCEDLVLVGRRPHPLLTLAGELTGQQPAEEQVAEAEAHFAKRDGSVLATAVLGPSGVLCLVISGCDVSNEQNVVAAVALSLRVIGDITVLVNNAGIGSDNVTDDFSQSLCETTWADWKRVMEVNIGGTFLCTREVVAQHWNTTKRGAIVNVSSKAGVLGFANLGAYSTSKWAMEGFTKCMAVELSDRNITVNSFSPGRVETPGFPASEGTDRSAFLTPEDSALPFLYLCVVSGVSGMYLHAGEVLRDCQERAH